MRVPCHDCLRLGFQCLMCQDPDHWERLAYFVHFENATGEMRELWKMALKKPGPNGQSAGALKVQSSSAGFLETYEHLTEFLLSTSYEDGSRRERGTLLILVSSGGWQLKVKDPTPQRYAFYVASTLEEALLGLNEGIGSDKLDWRPEKPWPGKGK